jgi:hypothetical protein
MFEMKNVYYYLVAFIILTILAFVGNKFKSFFEGPSDEYDLIRAYLLNESPLYGYNKPKIWIHSKFEYNARKWKSFQSRSSTDLNQPYVHLTIQSIIDHCGQDFHVCLIDDNTFSKLIPTWDIDIKSIAEPMKSHMRDIAMAELIYYYGGVSLPNTFICLSNLKDFYLEATQDDKAFVCESINHYENILLNKAGKKHFIPDIKIMGANKNNKIMKELATYLKERVYKGHFTNEHEFIGDVSAWCLAEIDKNNMNLVNGAIIGIKTAKGEPILLDDLMSDIYIDVSTSCIGIAVPGEEALRRTKYQWLPVISAEEVLKSDFMLAKYIKLSIMNRAREHIPEKIRNVISL